MIFFASKWLKIDCVWIISKKNQSIYITQSREIEIKAAKKIIDKHITVFTDGMESSKKTEKKLRLDKFKASSFNDRLQYCVFFRTIVSIYARLDIRLYLFMCIENKEKTNWLCGVEQEHHIKARFVNKFQLHHFSNGVALPFRALESKIQFQK